MESSAEMCGEQWEGCLMSSTGMCGEQYRDVWDLRLRLSSSMMCWI